VPNCILEFLKRERKKKISRVVQFVDIGILDPRQGFLLRTGSWYPEGDRRFCPFNHPVDHPQKKYDDSNVGNDYPEQDIKVCHPNSQKGDHDKSGFRVRLAVINVGNVFLKIRLIRLSFRDLIDQTCLR